MDVRIDNGWRQQLAGEFDKDYFIDLVSFVKAEYGSKTIYPPGSKIFNAFDHCSWDKLKVVIIGQDPYHGPNQANGLCFSVSDAIRKPPSLVNIFKEINADLDIPIPESGNLEKWADQGVLLLNATLTVKASSPGSHQKKGWEVFTDAVISRISSNKEHIVFLLWGAFAQSKYLLIDEKKHFIFKSPHPSPFSADRGFFGNKHFSKTNSYLSSVGKDEIIW